MFSVLRAVCGLFRSPVDPYLGLYGAFGYDLVFQFEELSPRLSRSPRARDLVLYLPDEIVVVDRASGRAQRHSYELAFAGRSTSGLPRPCLREPYRGGEPVAERELPPGGFARMVERAKRAFASGDLFEVTPSQVFRRPCPSPPSVVFQRLRARNPAPYGCLINLGRRQYLVGASPEMYVRVQGRRVETCPIAGTIARGDDALGDAAQIRTLLTSDKEEAELTMCTDVDRNDKARVCEAGSVRVLSRRQIEIYSRLIHTVDHIEGRLREGYDAIDAFLTHAWAVTVTGAPKPAAMQFIEDTEASPRAFYGGALGVIGFDGGLNTGLTLRTIQIDDGVAVVRAGATLLHDSDPASEEAETELKASALLAALSEPEVAAGASASRPRAARSASRLRVLLVDHRDSFVHTLGDYLRQCGAEITTLRAGFPAAVLDRLAPELVVLSPGPGRPADFAMARTLDLILSRELPVFGVCLGLQGIAEYFGASLGQLERPMHGKPSTVRVSGGRSLRGLPPRLTVGRYHSLFVRRESLPPELAVVAETDDEARVVMALEHRELPLCGVQFHPESIMSGERGLGLRLVESVLSRLTEAAPRKPS